MQITALQATNSLDILDRYSVRAVSKNRRLYLTLARVLREVMQIQQAHEKAVNLLTRSYGKSNEKGQLEVLPDKMREHGERVFEYLAEQHDLDLPGKIALEEFEKAGIQPTGAELATLDWLIRCDSQDGFLFSGESPA